MINNLLLPQASEGEAASEAEQEREAGEASLAPQALTALAPMVQSPPAVPVSWKPDLGKAYQVILPALPGRQAQASCPSGNKPTAWLPKQVGGWAGGYFGPD